jgi:ankyrin repeat protein
MPPSIATAHRTRTPFVWSSRSSFLALLLLPHCGSLRHGVGRLRLHRETTATTASEALNLKLPAPQFLIEVAGLDRDVISGWLLEFPQLATLDTRRHVAPKWRFLTRSLLGASSADATFVGQVAVDDPEDARRLIAAGVPPQFFGARLEKVVAPRHAFLASRQDLPSGAELLRRHGRGTLRRGGEDEVEGYYPSCSRSLFADVLAARTDRAFATLCSGWAAEEAAIFGGFDPQQHHDQQLQHQHQHQELKVPASVRSDDVHGFCSVFQRGLLAAVRGELQEGSGVSAGTMVRLLLEHGATDEYTPPSFSPSPSSTSSSSFSSSSSGAASALHWACGCGNLEAAQALCSSSSSSSFTSSSSSSSFSSSSPSSSADDPTLVLDKQGASVIHWAAAGAEAHRFGTGGHRDVVKWLVEERGMNPNAVTVQPVNPLLTNEEGTTEEEGYDDDDDDDDDDRTAGGNTVLMWAAWGGSLDVVRLLVDEFGADTAARNSRGCTVAHWAAGGGSVEVCRFLAGERGVPFDGVRNHRGSTPLTKAVAHASAGVLDWFLHENSQSQSQSQNQNQNQKNVQHHSTAAAAATAEGGSSSSSGFSSSSFFGGGSIADGLRNAHELAAAGKKSKSSKANAGSEGDGLDDDRAQALALATELCDVTNNDPVREQIREALLRGGESV